MEDMGGGLEMLCISSRKQQCRNVASHEEIHLHIRCGEDAGSAMMFSFKPVGVYLPVYVNDVAFLQRELPEERIMRLPSQCVDCYKCT